MAGGRREVGINITRMKPGSGTCVAAPREQARFRFPIFVKEKGREAPVCKGKNPRCAVRAVVQLCTPACLQTDTGCAERAGGRRDKPLI